MMKNKLLVAIALVFTILCLVSCEYISDIANVTFDLNGAGNTWTVGVKSGEKISEPAEPSRDGYVFEGWYLEEEKFDFSTPITKNIKLIAKWAPKSPIVTFDSNGGTEVASIQLDYGTKLTIPSNPTREGDYEFLGWTLNGENFNNEVAITNNITLKALWGTDLSTSGEYVVLNATQNIKYKTLLSAVNESKENDTIILLSDYVTPNLGNWIEYNFADGCIFDLNGYKLTNNVNAPGTTEAGVDSQSVYQGKNITVQNGKIDGDGSYVLFIGNETKDTSFTLKNITTIGGINCYVAKVTLKEGNHFDASTKEYYAVYGDEATQIVIEDGKYIGGTNGITVMQFNYEGNTIEITGGEYTGKINTFTNSNSNGNALVKVTGGKFSDDPSSYVPEGYTTIHNVNGTYTVTKVN